MKKKFLLNAEYQSSNKNNLKYQLKLVWINSKLAIPKGTTDCKHTLQY